MAHDLPPALRRALARQYDPSTPEEVREYLRALPRIFRGIDGARQVPAAAPPTRRPRTAAGGRTARQRERDALRETTVEVLSARLKEKRAAAAAEGSPPPPPTEKRAAAPRRRAGKGRPQTARSPSASSGRRSSASGARPGTSCSVRTAEGGREVSRPRAREQLRPVTPYNYHPNAPERRKSALGVRRPSSKAAPAGGHDDEGRRPPSSASASSAASGSGPSREDGAAAVAAAGEPATEGDTRAQSPEAPRIRIGEKFYTVEQYQRFLSERVATLRSVAEKSEQELADDIFSSVHTSRAVNFSVSLAATATAAAGEEAGESRGDREVEDKVRKLLARAGHDELLSNASNHKLASAKQGLDRVVQQLVRTNETSGETMTDLGGFFSSHTTRSGREMRLLHMYEVEALHEQEAAVIARSRVGHNIRSKERRILRTLQHYYAALQRTVATQRIRDAEREEFEAAERSIPRMREPEPEAACDAAVQTDDACADELPEEAEEEEDEEAAGEEPADGDDAAASAASGDDDAGAEEDAEGSACSDGYASDANIGYLQAAAGGRDCDAVSAARSSVVVADELLPEARDAGAWLDERRVSIAVHEQEDRANIESDIERLKISMKEAERSATDDRRTLLGSDAAQAAERLAALEDEIKRLAAENASLQQQQQRAAAEAAEPGPVGAGSDDKTAPAKPSPVAAVSALEQENKILREALAQAKASKGAAASAAAAGVETDAAAGRGSPGPRTRAIGRRRNSAFELVVEEATKLSLPATAEDTGDAPLPEPRGERPALSARRPARQRASAGTIALAPDSLLLTRREWEDEEDESAPAAVRAVSAPASARRATAARRPVSACTPAMLPAGGGAGAEPSPRRSRRATAAGRIFGASAAALVERPSEPGITFVVPPRRGTRRGSARPATAATTFSRSGLLGAVREPPSPSSPVRMNRRSARRSGMAPGTIGAVSNRGTLCRGLALSAALRMQQGGGSG